MVLRRAKTEKNNEIRGMLNLYRTFTEKISKLAIQKIVCHIQIISRFTDCIPYFSN